MAGVQHSQSRYHQLLFILTEDGWCLAQLVKLLSIIIYQDRRWLVSGTVSQDIIYYYLLGQKMVGVWHSQSNYYLLLRTEDGLCLAQLDKILSIIIYQDRRWLVPRTVSQDIIYYYLLGQKMDWCLTQLVKILSIIIYQDRRWLVSRTVSQDIISHSKGISTKKNCERPKQTNICCVNEMSMLRKVHIIYQSIKVHQMLF